MKIELSIKADYLSWGRNEGVRELMQNGQDAMTQFGATFEVRHRTDTSTLVIENEGCTLPHEALLLGHTTKTDRSDLIGHFGEGLKLGVLALIRSGHDVKIRSGAEVWVPKIQRSDKFDADVLVFYINTGREPKNRVQVEIGGISEADWGEMKDGFLFLDKKIDKRAIKTCRGSLLLGDAFAGKIFVKGIFVQRVPDLRFGYNFQSAELDRDRRMVESYDLNSRMCSVWQEALSTRPDLINSFLDMLESEAKDVKDVDVWRARYFSEEVKEAARERFVNRHGANSLPAGSLDKSLQVEHMGKTGIVVPSPMLAILEQTFGTVEENFTKLAKETLRQYGLGELSSVERANLDRAMALVGRVTPITFSDIDIIDLRDANVNGTCQDGRVRLTKKILMDTALTLEILIHETAHKLGGGDGEKSHVVHIEKIWGAIVTKLTES